jgi:hypothetical protein
VESRFSSDEVWPFGGWEASTSSAEEAVGFGT